MKTKSRQFLALSTVLTLALFITVTSCHKDNDSPGASGQFSANVAGSSFQPAAVTAVATSGSITITGYQIKSGDTVYMTLTMPDNVTVSSKPDFSDIGTDLYYYNSKASYYYTTWASASHGGITFTSVDKTNKKIAGKFSGVIYKSSGSDSVVVKDGQFNTTYK